MQVYKYTRHTCTICPKSPGATFVFSDILFLVLTLDAYHLRRLREDMPHLAHTRSFVSSMDEVKRSRVIDLASKGWGQRRIVRETGFARSFVQRWYRRKSARDMPKSERPPKLTGRLVTKIRAVMKVNRPVLQSSRYHRG